MLKMVETKLSTQYTDAAINLYHNGTYYAGQLQATTQGTTNPSGIAHAGTNRVGDEVIARGVSLKFFLENMSDRPNVMYNIYIFKYNVLLIDPAAMQLMTDNEFWASLQGEGATVTNRMLDKPQKRNIQLLKKIVIKGGPNYSIQTAGPVPVGPFAKTNYRQVWIPLKDKKIRYRLPDSPLPERDGLGFAIVAYDAISTLQTDQLAKFQWQSTFYYKDP